MEGPQARIQLADASYLYSKEYIYVSVDFGPLAQCLQFTILDVDCPPILGMPFLRTTNPSIDWSSSSISFSQVTPSTNLVACNSFAGLENEVTLGARDSNSIISSSTPPPTVVAAKSRRRSKQRRVSFDSTTVALHDCEQVGGFLRCFDLAARGLKKQLTLSHTSCTYCEHPVLDTTLTKSLPGERTCRSCLRTFTCPSHVVCNPLASFMEDTRMRTLLPSSPIPTAEVCQVHTDPSSPDDNEQFLRLVSQKRKSIQEVSFQSFMKALRRNQFEEAFYCFSKQLDHIDSELHFTHRTSYGTHGQGDQTSLGEEAANMMAQLKQSHAAVFQEPSYPVPREPIFEHQIHLKDPTLNPPRKKIYPLDATELAALKEQLNILLESGRIRHSSSPYGAPILFAKKKDSTQLRMCIDYRALNANTVLDRYPLPRIDNLLSQLRGATVFSKLDLRDGYHQLPLCKEDAFKTAFCTRYGQFEFTVMPFGLCNAPSTFQRAMNQIFFDLLDCCVLVYLDDILIYSSSIEQHRKDICRVFDRLQQHQFCLKESKCRLFLESIEFLGHVISSSGISVDPGKIDAIATWPTPSSLHEV